jgi:hypothetical protein
LSVPDDAAGAVTACPDCGKKLRIPAAVRAAPPAARPAPRPRPAPPADDGGGYSVLPPEARAEIPKEEYKTPLEYRRDDDEEEPDDEPEEQEEAPRKKKKRRKKKQQQQIGLSKGVVVGLSVGGVVLAVAALTAVLFFALRPGPGKKEDQNQLVAELIQAGATVRRAGGQPDGPVTEVSFMGSEINAKLLGRLKAFPQLEVVNLASTKTSDVILEHLEDLTQIRVLNLGHTKVTSKGMQFLKNLKNLEELNLSQTLVMDDGLEELKGLTKLKKLSLDGSLASGLNLQAAIPGLQVFK